MRAGYLSAAVALAAVAALTAITNRVSPRTRTGCATTKSTSTSMPIETKKTLAKTSRNGVVSATTWGLYSLSETMIPATKAPSASEKPSDSVT